MGKLPSRIASRLLQTARTSPQLLPVISWVLRSVVPFNAPHGFAIGEISERGCSVIIPFKRKNRNHLGSMHACALVTGGEMAAGLYLATACDPRDFRLLLSALSTRFLIQAKEPLTARCESTLPRREEIAPSESREINLLTRITNRAGETVAEVETTWHLSRWR